MSGTFWPSRFVVPPTLGRPVIFIVKEHSELLVPFPCVNNVFEADFGKFIGYWRALLDHFECFRYTVISLDCADVSLPGLVRRPNSYKEDVRVESSNL